MECDFCDGTNRVARIRECGSVIDIVSCPCCVRGVSVLGTHEMLRDSRGGIHLPGEHIDPQYTMTGPGTFRIEDVLKDA